MIQIRFAIAYAHEEKGLATARQLSLWARLLQHTPDASQKVKDKIFALVQDAMRGFHSEDSIPEHRLLEAQLGGFVEEQVDPEYAWSEFLDPVKRMLDEISKVLRADLSRHDWLAMDLGTIVDEGIHPRDIHRSLISWGPRCPVHTKFGVSWRPKLQRHLREPGECPPHDGWCLEVAHLAAELNVFESLPRNVIRYADRERLGHHRPKRLDYSALVDELDRCLRTALSSPVEEVEDAAVGVAASRPIELPKKGIRPAHTDRVGGLAGQPIVARVADAQSAEEGNWGPIASSELGSPSMPVDSQQEKSNSEVDKTSDTDSASTKSREGGALVNQETNARHSKSKQQIEPSSHPTGDDHSFEPAGYLGILIDRQRYTVKREHYKHTIDFSGSKLKWDLLMHLIRLKDRFSSMDALRGVWVESGTEDYPQHGTIRDALSKLSRQLEPLRLMIKGKRSHGWQLIDRPDSPAAPRKGNRHQPQSRPRPNGS
jgi:hypothetical protein